MTEQSLKVKVDTLEKAHEEIKQKLEAAKKHFQGLNAEDLGAFRESFEVFIQTLHARIGDALDDYFSEKWRAKCIEELQNYVNQGLRFGLIKMYNDEYHGWATFELDHQNNREIPGVILERDDDFPF